MTEMHKFSLKSLLFSPVKNAPYSTPDIILGRKRIFIKSPLRVAFHAFTYNTAREFSRIALAVQN